MFHEGEDEIDALQVGPTSWQRRSTDPISPDAKLTVELGPATSVEVTEFRRQEVVVTLPRLGEMEARLEGGMSGEQWSCSVKPLENGQSPSRVDHRLVAEGATAIFVSRFETLDLETDQRARVLAFPGSTWSVRAVYRSYELEPSYAEVICPGSAVFVPASTFPTISITGLPEGSRVALYQATRGRGPVP